MPPLRVFPTRLRFAALRSFLRSEAAGGAVLMLSAAAALAWANSSAGDLYRTLLQMPVLHETPLVIINDGLMAVFFLLVGLELRREITVGELASPARLAAPGLAALGGMVVPALILVALNWRDRTALRGWAVPVATDIAFALAVLAVLGRRVPVGLKVFLTALAIIDDLGAILVIALFYTRGLNLWDLGGAALVWLGLFGLNRAGVRALWPYLLGGAALWALVFGSGIHATLSGVALALVIPMRGRPGEAQAPAQVLEHRLGQWVAYGILPLFGLANAGLRFDTLPPGAWTDRLAIGTALGLFLGKQIGVFGAVMAASRLGLARLPAGVTLPQLYGGAVLCGIGFTMSLFIGDLAFRGSPRGDEVKLAVFVGSLLSALAGLAVLAAASRVKERELVLPSG
ncbi:MAG: Na+/H+ antiporter NhaA [Janthinobacterium lividum]